MNVRLRSQVVKEMLSYLRDPRSRMTLIVPPLMQLLIFSFAATLEVRNVDIAVLDRDSGAWSREMVQRVDAAGFVDRIVPVNSLAELRRLVDHREVLLGLHFDAGFSRDIEAGRPAEAQLLVDGRRANAGQIAVGYIEAVAAQLGAELAPAGGVPPPSTVVRHAFNPNLTYRWFIVPSLSGILAMFISLVVTSLSIARERELGTFDQLLVSPATPLEIVVGKTVPAVILGTVLGTIMITAGILIFGIPFTGSLPLLLASLVLFILSIVGIGLMLSSVCGTQQQAILGTFSVAVPIVLISGFATPVENMPDWLQWVAQASPLKYYLVIVQGSFLKALPPEVVLANAWPMAAIALVTLTSAVVLVKRRLS